jgi:hypothetical protein
MEDFKGSPTSLVADVDCTAEGKDLCEKFEVRGYPTIKYGDPAEMKDYQGGRTYDALKKFADESLGPTCGPTNLDLCSESDKTKLESFMKMSVGKLEGRTRNALKAVEEDVPIMKKVLAYMKKEL